MCVGALGPTIADAMGRSPSQTCAPAYRCGDLATAVKMARTIAAPGDVVLLSPGCASYDQFVNFQERGAAFARLARAQ
jgi:UDP-N-acetylmuramoylalanine--D-glutamate ligase